MDNKFSRFAETLVADSSKETGKNPAGNQISFNAMILGLVQWGQAYELGNRQKLLDQ